MTKFTSIKKATIFDARRIYLSSRRKPKNRIMNAELIHRIHLLNDIECQNLAQEAAADEFDLVLLMCEVIALLRPHIRKTVILEIEANQSFSVCLPENSLRLCLFNLVLNAVTAVEGNESAHICISVHKAGTQLFIQVLDNGKGFSDAVLTQPIPALRHSRQHNSGLGLALTQHFVNRVGGQLQLNNRSGQGASVSMILPESCILAVASV